MARTPVRPGLTADLRPGFFFEEPSLRCGAGRRRNGPLQVMPQMQCASADSVFRGMEISARWYDWGRAVNARQVRECVQALLTRLGLDDRADRPNPLASTAASPGRLPPEHRGGDPGVPGLRRACRWLDRPGRRDVATFGGCRHGPADEAAAGAPASRFVVPAVSTDDPPLELSLARFRSGGRRAHGGCDLYAPVGAADPRAVQDGVVIRDP